MVHLASDISVGFMKLPVDMTVTRSYRPDLDGRELLVVATSLENAMAVIDEYKFSNGRTLGVNFEDPHLDAAVDIDLPTSSSDKAARAAAAEVLVAAITQLI